MKNKTVLSTLSLSVILSLAAPAFADLLTLTPGPDKKKGVNISTGATATVKDLATGKDKEYKLTTVGSGVRSKTVIIAEIPVYVVQLFIEKTDSSPEYTKTPAGALPSLDKQSVVALRLSFVRNVDASTITTAFKDALNANKISAQDSDIVMFLNEITRNGDAQEDGSVTIVLIQNEDGTRTLAYENIRDEVASTVTPVKGSKELTHKVLSMWLGAVAHDTGLVDLKEELLK
jgi:hypothetical protein